MVFILSGLNLPQFIRVANIPGCTLECMFVPAVKSSIGRRRPDWAELIELNRRSIIFLALVQPALSPSLKPQLDKLVFIFPTKLENKVYELFSVQNRTTPLHDWQLQAVHVITYKFYALDGSLMRSQPSKARLCVTE